MRKQLIRNGIFSFFVMALLPGGVFAMNTWDTGYEVSNDGVAVSIEVDDGASGTFCKEVTNNGSENYFVPTKTVSDWNEFEAFLPTGVIVVPCITAIEITTCVELQLIGNDGAYPLDGDYLVVNDIDCSATATWNSDGSGGYYGFDPIGNFPYEFTGIFDGNNKEIKDLYINRGTTDHIGLFGYADGSTIGNVKLVGINITGKNYTGGLVGRNDNSTLMNSSVTGTVTSTGAGNYVGGLVGYNNISTITNSYATSAVSGEFYYVGGLVGYNNTSVIENSYATGAVSGESYYVGGLVGYNHASTITNSYATGIVLGTGNDEGGLVGANNVASTITSSYWNTETSGQATSDGGVGKTMSEMADQTTFDTVWDYTATPVWKQDSIPPVADGFYPCLSWQDDSTCTVIDFSVITTCEQLQNIGNDANYPLSGSYTVANDIDCSATDPAVGGSVWGAEGFAPIGDSTNRFTGIFDGNNKTISDLYINRGGTVYIGLFSYTDGAEIKNINLVDVDMTGNAYVGGLVGNNSATITNSSATGSITGGSYVGGLVGYNRATIINSYATSSVLGTSWHTGGLVGWNGPGASITNAYATGSVSGRYYVGGLVGIHTGAAITNSYSVGDVSGMDYVGGFVGQKDATINNSYWNRSRSGQSSGCGSTSSNCDGVTGKTTSEMAEQTTFDTVWDYTVPADWKQDSVEPVEEASYPCLSWQEDSTCSLVFPIIEISTCEELQLIGSGGSYLRDGLYRVMNDIDCSATNPDDTDKDGVSPGQLFNAGSVWDNGGLGFVPIGGFMNIFSGIFDGNNKVISDLYIDRENIIFVGLFSFTNGAEIKNVGLTNINIVGLDYVGGLVAYSDTSVIINSYVTGSVTGKSTAGGLAGRSYHSTITNSYATVSVTGVDWIGGLIGDSWDSTTMNSYATGSVTGDISVGGLIGDSYASSTTNSYATGLVTGISDAGGLIGNSFDVVTTNSYWNTETSGQVTSAGGVGKTISQMAIQSTFSLSGWDYTDPADWKQNAISLPGNFYPCLGWQTDDTCTTNPSTVIPISTCEELQMIGNDGAYPLSGEYLVVNDIDCLDTVNWNAGAGFDPIGTFTGTFDGNNKIISDLYINRPTESNVGLFGSVSGAEIKNVGLTTVNIIGNNYVGGLVGSNSTNTTITNSSVTGSVSGNSYVGGFVGSNNTSVITSSYAAVNVTGSTFYTGGFIGKNNINSAIMDSYATGTVLGTASNVGGFIGFSDSNSPITNCYATGVVTGGERVGGLVGQGKDASIENSHATGNVNGTRYIGGLAGFNSSNNSIIDSYATGTVTATDIDAGGLVGHNWTGVITDSYATGAVNGTKYVGGLVGHHHSSSSITNSYATGNVTGMGDSVGGLVGTILGTISTVTNSYSTGTATGTDLVGGLVGQLTGGAITDSYALGAVTGTARKGGLLGFIQTSTITDSYWNTETTGLLEGCGSGICTGATGKTINDMAFQSTFEVVWDYATDWKQNAISLPGNFYPCLGWQTDDTCTTNPSTVIPISTCEELQLIGNDVNYPLSGEYLVVNDIDCSATVTWNSDGSGGYYGFDPIGDNSTGDDTTRFTGIFDGKGYEIQGLYIDRMGENSDYIGLFGRTNGAEIKNVGLVNVDFTGYSFVGGIVGFNDSTDIINSYTTGEVNGLGGVGGIAGRHINDGAITNSYSAADVLGSNSSADFIGGLVGWAYYAPSIVNSYATGAVSGDQNIGGLIGMVASGTVVTNSYAIGTVLGTSPIGGFIGSNYSGSVITGSYWDMDINADGCGGAACPGATGKTTAQMVTQSTYTDIGWDYTTPDWKQDSIVPSGNYYPCLDWQDDSTCTVIDFSVITTCEQLQKIGNDVNLPLNGSYTLGNDIDCSVTNPANAGNVGSMWDDAVVDNGTTQFGFGGTGFDPIGDSTIKFTGIFDGQGYIISDLYISRAGESNIGLFGYTSGAEIKNVGLTTVNIIGNQYTGGLVGRNYSSTITNAYATGSVTGSSIYVGGLVGLNYASSTITNAYAASVVTGGNDYAGGLVGRNYSSTITNAHATGSVTGGISVGGLVGMNDIYSTITNAYATGSVSGGDYYYVGGLVGTNNSSTIMNAYATGSVLGSQGAGGLVGYNYLGTITNAYATGSVLVGISVGGLFGYNVSSTITDSYWNTDSNSIGCGDDNCAGAAGKTTTQMKQQATFSGWNFTTIWNIVENSTYPSLR